MALAVTEQHTAQRAPAAPTTSLPPPQHRAHPPHSAHRRIPRTAASTAYRSIGNNIIPSGQSRVSGSGRRHTSPPPSAHAASPSPRVTIAARYGRSTSDATGVTIPGEKVAPSASGRPVCPTLGAKAWRRAADCGADSRIPCSSATSQAARNCGWRCIGRSTVGAIAAPRAHSPRLEPSP